MYINSSGAQQNSGSRNCNTRINVIRTSKQIVFHTNILKIYDMFRISMTLIFY